MLNGVDPVIVFHIGKLSPTVGDLLAKIPVVSSIPSLVEQPPVPIYLSEEATGIVVASKSKSVTFETDTQTKTDGTAPDVNQKGTAAGTTINFEANQGNLLILLLGALLDEVFDKASSKEYAISFFHGSTTIIRGLVHDFSIDEESDTTRIKIKLELSKGTKTPTPQATVPAVPGFTGTIPGG